MKVSIIGLGYVGLPLAVLCAKKGLKVTGIDINPKVVETINNQKSPFLDPMLENKLKKVSITAITDGTKELREADIIIVCVPTPITKDEKPNLEPLRSAMGKISANLQNNQIIIIESTIYPGVIEEICQPILEKNGLIAGNDFILAHCPERVDPANKKYSVSNIPRVVAATTKEDTKRVADFYRKIVDADIVELNSIKAAEATKVTENSFRDVNIAFVNELAKSFDKMGIDVKEVLEAAATKPYGFMIHYPGCGVGGHCIPVDPYYLIEKAKEVGFEHKFLSLARKINNSMPEFTLAMVQRVLGKSELKDSRICLLGLAYKKNVSDLRNSPGVRIKKMLEKEGVDLTIYDPFIDKYHRNSLVESIKDTDCIVIATDHDEFKLLTPKLLTENRVSAIVDGRNMLDKNKFLKNGINYQGIGR